MKKSEIIAIYQNEIASAMMDHYRYILECNGRIQYEIYIWEDGELEFLETVPGDHVWLQPRDAEPRALYHVCTVAEPGFDPWDCVDHDAPEDEEERETERQEIISYYMKKYEEEKIPDTLYAVVTEAKKEEVNDN